ncbi:hypothetical protein C8J55DRAFT_490183 [Lentinula edodes]|uniref:Uncharacterized protein n=1 Tax=Lentinula lateritia TaxID=40482 RepID=A0A9W9A7W6_9AGAR|nr:hypothetical protein C8J55DRAFT_490183 [Lentinula edodes]
MYWVMNKLLRSSGADGLEDLTSLDGSKKLQAHNGHGTCALTSRGDRARARLEMSARCLYLLLFWQRSQCHVGYFLFCGSTSTQEHAYAKFIASIVNQRSVLLWEYGTTAENEDEAIEVDVALTAEHPSHVNVQVSGRNIRVELRKYLVWKEKNR